MRLLLDEHYAKGIAEQLRERGHDVVVVTERPELVGLPDEQLFRLMGLSGNAASSARRLESKRCKDAGSANSRAIGATEDAAARRYPADAREEGLSGQAPMPEERRAMATENWAHFARLIAQATSDGLDHFGVIFTSAKQLPRGKKTIGLFVSVFDELLRANPADDTLLNRTCWLP